MTTVPLAKVAGEEKENRKVWKNTNWTRCECECARGDMLGNFVHILLPFSSLSASSLSLQQKGANILNNRFLMVMASARSRAAPPNAGHRKESSPFLPVCSALLTYPIALPDSFFQRVQVLQMSPEKVVSFIAT